MNKIITPIFLFLAIGRLFADPATDASDLIHQAQPRHLPYLIESAIMTVRLDSVTNTTTPKITDVEITYSLLALSSVTNFDEEYRAMTPEAQVFRIHGTLPESGFTSSSSPALREWNIPLHLQPGDHQTLVTGARYIYPHGLPEIRNIRDFSRLNPTEDVYCYPNSEDIIADLTIRIESPIPVQPPVPGEALLAEIQKSASSSNRLTLPSLYSPDTSTPAPYIVVAHWKNILPNQIAELKIRRGEAK